MKKLLTLALVAVFVMSAIIPMVAFADTAVVDFAVHPDLTSLGCSVSGDAGAAKTVQYCGPNYGRVTTAAAGNMDGLTITLEEFSGSTAGCAAIIWLSNNQYGWHNDIANIGGYGIMFYPTLNYVELTYVSDTGAGPEVRPTVSLGAALGNKVTFTFNKNADGSWKATVNDTVINIAAADLSGLKDTEQVYLSIGSFNFFGYEESVTCKITACAFGTGGEDNVESSEDTSSDTSDEESDLRNVRPAELPTAGTAGIDFTTHPDLENLEWVWIEGDAGDVQTVQATMGDPAVRVTTRESGQMDGMTLVIENIYEMSEGSACYLYLIDRPYGWHNELGKGGYGIVFSPNWDYIELNPIGQDGLAIGGSETREKLVLGEKLGDSLAFQIKKADDDTWTINVNGTAFDVDNADFAGIRDVENVYCSVGSWNFYGVMDVFLYDITGFYFGDEPTTPDDGNGDESSEEDASQPEDESSEEDASQPEDESSEEDASLPETESSEEDGSQSEDEKNPDTGVSVGLTGVVMALLSSGAVGVTLTSRKKARK